MPAVSPAANATQPRTSGTVLPLAPGSDDPFCSLKLNEGLHSFFVQQASMQELQDWMGTSVGGGNPFTLDLLVIF